MRAQLLLGSAVAVVLLGSARAGEVIKKQDVPGRIRLLKLAGDPKVRAKAAEELGRRGEVKAPDVIEAHEPLRNALAKDRTAEVRTAAAVALGRIAAEPKENVPALMEALKDKSDAVKMAAARALGQFGVEARPAVEALRELAKVTQKGKNKKLAQVAMQAVKMINVKK
jgi:HEAT repeat protein